jgi:prepilin-type N-terminal cleavage/methylation domain-containing protein
MHTSSPRPVRQRGATQRGVTLLETLVALSLFAITAATMGNFLVSQIRRSTSNYLFSQAYVLAEQQLETLRALPDYTAIVPGSTTTSVGGTPFTVATSVLNNTPADGLKQITVNVSWHDNFGAQNVAVQTIYTQVQRN